MRKKLLISITLLVAVLTAGCWYAYQRYYKSGPVVEPDEGLYPLRGIDVSAHNGEVDYERVKDAGYDFVFIKATEGTDFQDKIFIDNIRKAKAAGLRVGAYHFFRFDTDGNLQAVNFMHALRNRSLDFPAVIDVEEWGNPKDGIATSQIVGRLRQMIDRLEYHGREVVLYTNKDSYNRFIKGNFDQYPLWICSFTELDNNLDWAVWQYSHSGSVDGVNGKVDLNAIKTDFLR